MEQRGGVHKAPVKKGTIICGSWGHCTMNERDQWTLDVSCKAVFLVGIAIVLDLSDMRLRLEIISLLINAGV
jgi:hypothetical protein